MSRPIGADDFICENEEWGEQCDYPFCNCEDEDIFYDPFGMDFVDEIDIEQIEDNIGERINFDY